MIPARKFKEIWTECQVCQKPLGHESREEGFALCHEHRKCTSCGEELQVYEVNLCYDRALSKFQRDKRLEGDNNKYLSIEWKEVNITHSKCAQIGGPIPISQAEFDFLNDARLALLPDLDILPQTDIQNAQFASQRILANLDFERRGAAVKKWEALLEMCRSTVQSDPEYRRGIIEEKERERFDKVTQIREPKPQKSLKERYDKVEPLVKDKLSFESFTSTHTLIENLGQKELHSAWRKTVIAFSKFMSEDEAIKIADDELRKKGKIQ